MDPRGEHIHALDPVSALVDDCKIRLNEDGLSIRAVDHANVGMVDMSLAKSAFESYEADGGVIEGQTTLDGDVVRERDER